MRVIYAKRDLNPLYIQMRNLRHEIPNICYIHADKKSLNIYVSEWRNDDEEVSDEMEDE